MNSGPVPYHPSLGSMLQKLYPGVLGALMQAGAVKKTGATSPPSFPLDGASCLHFSFPLPGPCCRNSIQGLREKPLPHAAPTHEAEALPQGQQGREYWGLGERGDRERPPISVGFRLGGRQCSQLRF